jgi:beta-1,4-mannooligosaccharide/beta-1,4-mannosyl-N-acetylglucosamine phosphorylase
MPLQRYRHNPLITRRNIPETRPCLVDVSSVFNPGAVKFDDRYLLLLRVQNRGRETLLLKAVSVDGIRFSIDDAPVHFQGIEGVLQDIYHLYDPRITRIGDTYYIVIAMDMDAGCHLGIANTDDFTIYRFLGIISIEPGRNGVLFPEKVHGSYVMLARPNRTKGGNHESHSGDTICLYRSDDLLKWRRSAEVMQGRPHYWDELIGSGPPPVKTREGWLHIYHGVATHRGHCNIYQAGVVLLDLDDPAVVAARSRYNIMEPRESYEMSGQVPNVIFPSGMIVEEYDDEGFAQEKSMVRIYYGAADTSVCLVETTVCELIKACNDPAAGPV